MRNRRLVILGLFVLAAALGSQLSFGATADVALQTTPSAPEASVTALLATVYAGQTLVATTPTVGATATAAPPTDSERLAAAYMAVDGVVYVPLGGVLANGDGYIVSPEVIVLPEYVNEATANQLRQLSYSTLNSVLVEFYVILYDDTRAENWTWSNLTDSWTVTPLTYPAVSLPTVQAAYISAGASEPIAMFAQRVANARECAGTTCAVVVQLAIGTQVDVVGQVAGEIYRENDQWYQVRLNDGRAAFVHVSLLGPPVIIEVTEAVSIPSAPISVPQAQPQSQAPSSPYTCNQINDLNCDDFTAAQADAHLQMCGDEDHIDGDSDGDACEPAPR